VNHAVLTAMVADICKC